MISLHWHFWDALSKHMPACSTNAAENIISTQFLGAEKVEFIKKTSDYITWCQYWTWIGPFYAVVPHFSFHVLTDGLFAQHKGRWLDKNSLTQLWEDGQETQSKPQRQREESWISESHRLHLFSVSKSATLILSNRFSFPDKLHQYGRGDWPVPNMKYCEAAFSFCLRHPLCEPLGESHF